MTPTISEQGDHRGESRPALLKSAHGTAAVAGSPASTDDVAKGNFRAASSYDLAMVARGEGDAGVHRPSRVLPAHNSHRRSLRDLITRAVHRLSGDQNAR